MKRLPLSSLWPLLSLVALGCSHSSPTVVFHTLHSEAVKTKAPGLKLALEVRPVRLPDLIQRPQLVLQEAPSRFVLSETQHWGNALDEDIQQTLIQNLIAQLGSDAIVPFPEGRTLATPATLSLDIQRFEGQLGGTLVLEATWVIERPESKVPLRRHSRIERAVPSKSFEALVEAHSQALAALSQEIASALQAW